MGTTTEQRRSQIGGLDLVPKTHSAIARIPTEAPTLKCRSLLHEPLLHFIVLGSILFFFHRYVARDAHPTRITVTQYQVKNLSDNFRRQYGDSPSPQQLQSLIDEFAKNEMFYRAALKLGLDENDQIIRRRLIQKYEFLVQDLMTSAEPSETQLLDYYNRHHDRYRKPLRVSFAHIYFSPDLRGEHGAEQATNELAGKLNSIKVDLATDHGDSFPGPTNFVALSLEEVARVFGNGGLAERVFEVEPKHWSTPLRSGLGWHSVYVNQRLPAEQMTFDSVRREVRRDFLTAEHDRRSAESFEKLRQDFEIRRE